MGHYIDDRCVTKKPLAVRELERKLCQLFGVFAIENYM